MRKKRFRAGLYTRRRPKTVISTGKGIINDFTGAGTDRPDGVSRSASIYNL